MAETTDTTLDKQVVAAPEVSTEAKEQKVSDAPAAPDAQTSAGEVKLSSNAEAPGEIDRTIPYLMFYNTY